MSEPGCIDLTCIQEATCSCLLIVGLACDICLVLELSCQLLQQGLPLERGKLC